MNNIFRAYFLENAAKAQIDAYSYASSSGKKIHPISPEVVEKTWLKFQGQAERMFAYYNFESYRRKLGLIKETEESIFVEDATNNCPK